MPDNLDMGTEILRTLRFVQDNAIRTEEHTKGLRNTIEDIQKSLKEMQSSLAETEKKMISLSLETGEIRTLKDAMMAFHKRQDKMNLELRDVKAWVEAEQSRRDKQAERVADGLFGIGFGWLAQGAGWLLLLAYLGWQQVNKTSVPPQVTPPSHEKSEDQSNGIRSNPSDS